MLTTVVRVRQLFGKAIICGQCLADRDLLVPDTVTVTATVAVTTVTMTEPASEQVSLSVPGPPPGWAGPVPDARRASAALPKPEGTRRQCRRNNVT